MKRLIFFLLTVFATATMSAQNITGRLISDTDGVPVIGSTVIEQGTNNGVGVDNDGNFSIAVSNTNATLKCSCVGFETMEIAINGKRNLGTIKMKEQTYYLKDVVVSSQIATSRKTPIAATSLTGAEIDERIGSQEFVEVLKYTPGVHANRQGGGWCDSEIFMRGFDNTNIAVNINGVNMNDVENGSVYWSNWAGISDVVSVLQTQRGIGASKVSAPSVGGTINIITKGLESHKSGSVYYMMGNDGYSKTSFNVNSGLTKSGWAYTLLGSYTKGDGYAQGTSFESFNYFVNVSKRINDSHQLSLLFFGASQKHYGRSNALTQSEWDKVGNYMTEGKHWSRYNPDYGFGINAQRKTADFNEYHMPQAFLNHVWRINDKSNLSSTFYVSIGRGNGYATYGRDGYSEYDWYGSDYGMLNTKFRAIDGTFDYAKIQEINAASENGSKMMLAKQRGDHDWYGLASTYENALNEHFTLQAGIDMRYTKATHVNKIVDLYCGEYYIDDSRKDVDKNNNPLANNPDWVNAHLGVGDVVGRDYDSFIMKEGAFAQLEYAKNDFTAFVSGSVNNSSYWRYDRLYYSPDNAKSDKYNFLGGTAKAGANYNFNPNHNVFVNVGWITKAPQFKNGVFMSANTSNIINKEVKNEQSISVDLGYGFRNRYISFNASAYYTELLDKTMTKKGKMTNKTQYYMNMTGVNARHMGLEFELKARPFTWVDINAMLSIGHWTWNSSDVKGYAYDIYGNALTPAGETTTPGANDHAWAVINMKGIKIGGSAQTTAALEAIFKPTSNVRIGGGYNHFASNYAYYSLSGSSLSLGKELVASDPWEIPSYGNLDLMASYQFKIGRLKAVASGHVYNVLDKYNIEKAWNPSNVGTESVEADPSKVYMFFTPGRTWSVRLKIDF